MSNFLAFAAQKTKQENKTIMHFSQKMVAKPFDFCLYFYEHSLPLSPITMEQTRAGHLLCSTCSVIPAKKAVFPLRNWTRPHLTDRGSRRSLQRDRLLIILLEGSIV
ncbi:hypothetical protein AVEN_13469-1 [Araneus ventricosus]|uniref:Uncharacterized protein n=1 Tax=Araneus ventricosus TaxID=182803 RepID=A0A4Y2IXY1_ARAVE|nr:hypothetical protein AVEN_13469-1 [Araneus ventricosus]